MKEHYPYNDDLLKSPIDRERARLEYAPIFFALYDPALCERFEAADAIANRAKRRSRSTGLAAVILVTCALLAASIAPMIGADPWARVFGAAGAILGVAGSYLAIFIHPRSKRPWLEARLVTESLRQFHFRTLLRLAPDILEAAETGDNYVFDGKRDAALAAFDSDIIARKSALLTAIVDDPEPRSRLPFQPPSPDTFTLRNGALLLKAYRNLRISRQNQYADQKLSDHGGLFSSFPRRQAATLGWAGAAGVAILLMLHVASGLLIARGHAETITPALDDIAMLVALLSLAIRTIEEGLKPHAEVERYRHYQAATRRILDRFDDGDLAEKLKAADDLEDLAFDEMVIFLRSLNESRFTL